MFKALNQKQTKTLPEIKKKQTKEGEGLDEDPKHSKTKKEPR